MSTVELPDVLTRLRSGGRRNYRWIIRAISFILFLGAWEWGATRPNVFLIAPPSAVFDALIYELFVGQELLFAVIEAAEQALVGYVLAAIVGISVGSIVGLNEPARNAFGPVIDSLYAVPMISIVPLIIIWFGTGVGGKIFLVFMFCVFIIAFNVEEGMKETPEGLIETGKVYGASGRKMYTEVYFKASLPYVLTGLRLASGRAVRGMVVAELFIAAGSLGRYLIDSGTLLRIERLLAGIIFLSIIGVIAVASARAVEAYLLSYKR